MSPTEVWYGVPGSQAFVRRGRPQKIQTPADPGPGTTGASVTTQRDGLTYGDYEPTRPDLAGANATAGIPSVVTSLPDYNDPSNNTFVIPNGAIIVEKTIYGDVTVASGDQNTYMIRCKFVGGNHTPTGSTAVLNFNTLRTGSGIPYVIDSLIDPRKISLNRDGIVGHKFRAYRNEIRNTIDGIGTFIEADKGTTDCNAWMYGNYIHRRAYFYPDYKNGVSGATWHSDGNHTDGWQHQGGRNVRFIGNRVIGDAYYGPGSGAHPTKAWLFENGYAQAPGACVIIQDNTGQGLDDTVICQKNFFSGGLAHSNLKVGTYTYGLNKHYRQTAQKSGTWGGYWNRPDANRAGVNAIGLLTDTWIDGPYAGQTLVEPRDKGVEYS